MQTRVEVRKWSGKVTDKGLSRELESDKHARSGSLRTVKDLMAGANKELKAVNSALDSIRTYSYNHTLPWSSSTDVLRGPRLIPVAQVQDYLKEYMRLVQVYDQAKQEFLDVYETRRQQAITNLGSAAKVTDYPTKDEIADRFSVDIDLGVVPAVADFSRMPLPSDVAEHLGARMAQRQEVALKNAMNDLFTRVLEQVQRMATQLTKYSEEGNARLYKSLVGNIRDLCQLLAASNVAGDERLRELTERIDKSLCTHDVDVLKANPTTAGQVAKEATAIAQDIESIIEWY